MDKVSSFPPKFPAFSWVWKHFKHLIFNRKSRYVSSFPAKCGFPHEGHFVSYARVSIFLGNLERNKEKGGFLRLKSFHPLTEGWKHSWKAGNLRSRHIRRSIQPEFSA